MKWPLLGLCLLVASCDSRPGQSPPESTNQYAQDGCPAKTASAPAGQTQLAPTDFVEFNVITAFSPLGRYRVRVFSDGRVEREIPGCLLNKQDTGLQVGPEIAQKLIVRTRDGGFNQLCSDYSLVPQPGTVVDGDETSITLSLHGQSKTVRDTLGNPPAVYFDVSKAIQGIARIRELKDKCNQAQAKSPNQH